MFYRRMLVLLLFLACFESLSSKQILAQENARSPTTPEYVIEVRTPEGCLFAPIVAAVSRPSFPGSYAVQDAAAAIPSGVSSYLTNSGSLIHTPQRPTYYLPDSAGRPVTSAVTFVARQNGDLWNFKVLVRLGEFYDAGEYEVADLMLRTNERAEINGVTRFGLSAFRVAVVKVIGQPGRQPYVNNKTQSLALEKLEVGVLPEPHLLTLRNKSDKHVLAIQYNSFKNGKFLFLRWLENGPTEPLIKAGDTYRLEAVSQDLVCGDPDGYRAAQSNMIAISSVVFADGSYEGEQGLAALIRGQAIGNKKLLQRVVSTLENLSAGSDPNPAELIFYLRNLYRETDDVAEPYLAEQLQRSLPGPHGSDSIKFLTDMIRFGQHEVRSSLSRDAEQLERMNRPQNAKIVLSLSEQTLAKYKRWLAAAEAVTSY